MIYFIRHSERLDHVDNNLWKKDIRYDDYYFDPPLSENGFHLAINKFMKLFEEKKENIIKISYIYTSPLTRCVETSICFQKTFYKLTGKTIPIRIEHSLITFIDNSSYKFIGKGKLQSKLEFVKNKLMIIDDFFDETYSSSNVINRFYNVATFDKQYVSNTSLHKINKSAKKGFIESYNDFLTYFLSFVKSINNNNNNKNTIACTHGENIIAYHNFINSNPQSEWITQKEHVFGYNYCYWIEVKFEKNNKIKITAISKKEDEEKNTKS